MGEITLNTTNSIWFLFFLNLALVPICYDSCLWKWISISLTRQAGARLNVALWNDQITLPEGYKLPSLACRGKTIQYSESLNIFSVVQMCVLPTVGIIVRHHCCSDTLKCYKWNPIHVCCIWVEADMSEMVISKPWWNRINFAWLNTITGKLEIDALIIWVNWPLKQCRMKSARCVVMDEVKRVFL